MKESMKLLTKLRHVDIHNHWLCQEYAEWTLLFKWTSTRDMIADGLTKVLSPQRHEAFIKLIKLDDISKWIEVEKRMEALRDKIRAAESPSKAIEMIFLVCRGIKTRGIRQKSSSYI